MRVLALALAALLLGGAVARANVVLAPSALAGTCVLDPPTDPLRPVPKGCLSGNVSGEPVFSPDGKMLYLTGDPPSVHPRWRASQAAVFARDPATGVLTRLDCQTPLGGTRCPPANHVLAISPDGRSLYALDATSYGLTVYDRADDGTLTQVQCLEIRNPAYPYPTPCDAVLPRSMTWMRMSPDGSSLYLAGNVDGETDFPYEDPAALVRLARDGATGRLTVTDCLTGGNQPGCRVDSAVADVAGIAAVVDQDVYLIAGDGFRAFRWHPETGTLVAICGAVTAEDPAGCGSGLSYMTLKEAAPAPDGRRIYVAVGEGLLAYPRDPATGQLGKATCAALVLLRKDRSVCSDQNHSTQSVAVSPDGGTVVTAIADSNPKPEYALATYHVAAGGSMTFAGCLGIGFGCAPPVGRPVLVRYPPNGPGPYAVTRDHHKGAVQLLAPAPAVGLRNLTFKGANRVSISCPAVRTGHCQGTIRVSFITHPRGTELLQRFPYDVGPGQTRSVSLRLTPAARREARRVFGNVSMVVGVFDDAGLTTPTGVTTCLLDPSRYRCVLS